MIVRWSPNELQWAIRGDDIWKLAIPAYTKIITDDGAFRYECSPGYSTDFRSGPSLINPIIPKIGNQRLALAWYIHDVNYHGYLSRKQADDLLYQMLLWAGMSTLKAGLVYKSVRLFGASHYSNLDDDQGPLYNANRDSYIKFEWSPK